ncbi:PspC domain-containing protein [Psychroserpens ponticola]|uniref:PspC domain-containing protein n=1 Tax=Psychroserpens ponticola TaxID=2932268 RepID=A0ABY7RZP3_9FLAO|nr:PspC domain-containing protein [Psychroserpens ponticola]WCO02609.1 PspC domain-containing protein [Psychroserpens ponticola]
MNKTVNINLAGIFFHIDEDAYLKLQRYLEAIKRSFTDSQGQSEIISDIEHRIAELFNERVQNEKQVIRIKEVDDVITIMGQPEDYLVDDEIFEDEPKTSYHRNSRSNSSSSKKFYRDTDNSYVGGVSSGLAHYFGIDPIWIRIIWIVLIFGAGTGVLLYILLWVLVPEAKTTSEKITMTGAPVNISNIEKKIKDGFDSVSQSVSDTVKNVDLPKQGQKIKSSSKSFFDTIGDIIMFFFKVFAKFIGIILIIVGAATLISLLIFCMSLGAIDIIHFPGLDIFEAANAANTPVWLISLIALFAIGVPFFFVFYLGLKILINNLKSIGNVAKFTLLGLWLMAIIGSIVIGVRQASEHAYDATVTTKEQLDIKASDTLTLAVVGNTLYSKQFGRHSNVFRPVYDDNDNKLIYSTDVRLIVRSTKDSLASIHIEKTAEGRNYKEAKLRSQEIDYSYDIKNNRLELDGFLTTAFENKFRDQEIEVTLYLPEGTILYAEENTYSYHRNSSYYNDILDNGMENQYLEITNNGVKCLDCPIDDEFKVKVDIDDDETGLRIDEDGIEIKTEGTRLKIDEDGIDAKSVNVKVNIGEDGIEITSEDN